MFDFRITYCGFAGLNFSFAEVIESFARKLS